MSESSTTTGESASGSATGESNPDGECTLCGLSTGARPVTDEVLDAGERVPGAYCCRGCLEIARTLDDVQSADAESVRERRDAESATADVPDDADRTYLAVDGMHCATCEVFVESAVADAEGVHGADASYATDMLRVAHEGDADLDALGSRLDRYGYGVDDPEAAANGDDRIDAQLVRFLLGGGIFGMMVMLWYALFLYPSYLGYEPLVDLGGFDGLYLFGNVWLMSSIVLFYTGYPILRGAVVSLRAGRPNMDLLVSLAATSSYLYSAVAVLVGRTHVYFDVTVAIVLVVTLGNYYEDRIKRRAASGLSELTSARVAEATRVTASGDAEPVAVADHESVAVTDHESVPVSALEPGDSVLVRPGERVPVDGEVVAGTAAVDESLVTGESVPETRRPGDRVLGGTVVTDDHLVVEVGEDAASTLDGLVDLLWDIQSSRSGVQRLADKLATLFVPTVLVLAVVATGYHLLTGAPVADALLAGLTVLIVSCPCALGLATPLAVASGIREAADRGVVVASDAVFESAPEVDVVVLDKTGTLTDGRMAVRTVVTDDSATGSPAAEEVLARAGALERYSAHPIAEAVVEAASEAVPASAAGANAETQQSATATATATATGIDTVTGTATATQTDASEAATAPQTAASTGESTPTNRPNAESVETLDRGVTAEIAGETVAVGHPDLLAERGLSMPDALRPAVESAREAGEVPVAVGWADRVRGIVVVGDEPRAGWRETVADLADGRDVVVLTGDDERAVARYREAEDVSEVFAGVPPEAKAETVERLQSRGTVAMVGDGSNDAPALATADFGVALGSGTDLAGDAADAVVVDGGLDAVPAVFDVARATNRRIRHNLGWAFLYNAVAVPLAALGLLNPLFAAVAMGTSSLVVVANSARSLE
ncbi:heavy metal translocating P-type ATPase [Halorussus litoreus]|uniref:heavy metal translocating P-type ATPase n=1 Tax=Halorussus litoreus TaxID=1710536 RepID=UPI000E264FAB|nr:cation-translocating P-type ATPase [Halorussus litoreus]